MELKTIYDQYQANLISQHEALSFLESAEVRAAYDRDYSDTFDGYRRFQKIMSDAQRYQARIRRGY